MIRDRRRTLSTIVFAVAGVSDDFGADFCQLEGSAPDTEEMIVARDGVWIYLSTSNRNGRAFLSDIATGIWG